MCPNSHPSYKDTIGTIDHFHILSLDLPDRIQKAGGVQWMCAGPGVVQTEMPVHERDSPPGPRYSVVGRFAYAGVMNDSLSPESTPANVHFV